MQALFRIQQTMSQEPILFHYLETQISEPRCFDDTWIIKLGTFVLAGERMSVNSELWYACAGPSISMHPLVALFYNFYKVTVSM